jgi:uncharacterized protein (TIGR00661 family)
VLPFEVKYRLNGLGFVFGKNGGVDLLETFRKSQLKRLLREVNDLPISDYDLVISDFEPVSSWACYSANKPCIALSHQAAVTDKKAPHPAKADQVGRAILKYYAPATVKYGFHFAQYNEKIFTPVIRAEVRQAVTADRGHYTVYLPSYSDKKIIRILSQVEEVQWQVFSKHFEYPLATDNIRVFPLDGPQFINSMATASGVLCGAGFETPAESLYLKKKLMVIPMKNQYEQHCNAAALKQLGVPVIKSLKSKNIDAIRQWVNSAETVSVDFPDNTEAIINQVIDLHGKPAQDKPSTDNTELTVQALKGLTIRKILSKLTS